VTDQPTDVGTLAAPAAEDVRAVLTACHARLLEREGIAMFVALDDVRPGRTFEAREATALADGRRAAELLDHYYTGLEALGFPAQYPDEPDETGAKELIDALVVLSDQHLRARIGEEASA
jgi:hypothetical protein